MRLSKNYQYKDFKFSGICELKQPIKRIESMDPNIQEEFTDHTVPEDIQEHRRKLCQIWNDEEIVDCTGEAASLILLYKLIARSSLKDYSHLGKSLFFWDRSDKDILHFITQADVSKSNRFDLHILPDGTLKNVGRIYDSPKAFQDALTLEAHLVYKRVEILPDSTLGCVLRQAFTSECKVYFPPDYPPLLIQIALTNQDYKQAINILEHPVVDDPNLERGEKSRLDHVLEMILPEVIKGKYIQFLDYIIDKYDLLNPEYKHHALPLVIAIRLGDDEISSHLLGLYPKEYSAKIYEKALLATSAEGTDTYLQWLMENLPPDVNISTENQSAFLGNVLLRFGKEQFHETSRKFNISIDWQEFICKLSQTNVDPRVYLEDFIQTGGHLEDLDEKSKTAILLQALNTQNPNASLEILLKNFPELKSLLGKALNQVILDEKKINILLKTGVVPSEDNFETLLKTCEIGPKRLQLFLTLLEGIHEIAEAQKSLKITSSFGVEALAAVLKKFPKLEADTAFLFGMLNQTWKGTKFATEKLITDVLTPGKMPGRTIEGTNKKNPVLPSEEIYQLPTGGKGVVVDFLIDILLPAKEFEKIRESLFKRSEFIKEFWWKCIFSGISNVEDPQWDELAKATFPLMTAEERVYLVLEAIKYDQASLASLFLKNTEPLSADICIALFWTSTQCRDPRLAKALCDNGYVNIVNENGTSYLHICASENCFQYVPVLLANGANTELRDINNDTPYDIAVSKHCLTIVRMLRGEEAFQEIAGSLIHLDLISLENWLYSAFLNSSSVDVLKLLKVLHNSVGDIAEESRNEFNAVLDKVEHFVRYPGTLIVRFPSKITQEEIRKVYGSSYPTYEEQQVTWGNRCEKFYLELYNESQSKNFVMLEVLMKFAEPRAKEKGYESWRMGYPISGIGLVTGLGGRYFYFWGLAQGIYKALRANPDWQGMELQITNEGYRVFYQLPGGPLVPLTTLQIRKPFSKGAFNARFVHTGVNELKQFLPFLSYLFEEIKKAPKTTDENIDPDLKKKIAFFYWLGSHFCVTARGSAQYMLMLHRLCYNMHGFQASPWGQLYIEPDCVALMMPFQLFYDEYYDDLFEFPPQKIAT